MGQDGADRNKLSVFLATNSATNRNKLTNYTSGNYLSHNYFRKTRMNVKTAG